jgi:DnaK suppressor protein
MSPAKKTSARKPTPRSGARKTTAKAAPKKTTAKQTASKLPAKATAERKRAPKKAVSKSAGATRVAPKRTVHDRAPAKATAKKSAAEAPARKRGARAPRPAKLDRDTLAAIRAQLERERADLERQMQDVEEESFQGTQSDLTGEVGIDEDFADAGSATFERERAFSIQNNIRDLIDQINGALARIDEGSYGTCERCGRPIDAARLKALPHASLCMDCKRREERTR